MPFSPLEERRLENPQVNLVRIILDDSGSVRNHEHKLVNAYNTLITELLAADDNRDKYWVEMEGFNQNFRRELAPISPASQLAIEDYRAFGTTPLYGRTREMFMIQKSDHERLRKLGIAIRTASIVLTDGFSCEDTCHSSNVKPLAQELSQSPGRHQIFGIGILTGEDGGFGEYVTKPILGSKVFSLFSGKKSQRTSGSDEITYPTPYHYVFQNLMGFTGPGAEVIATENTKEAIADAMRHASQSIARVGAKTRKTGTGF